MKPASALNRGFTLIELLVVVAIIGLLIAIMVPSLTHARRQSRTAICASHLRTLGQGWRMYADEHRGTLLPGRLPVYASGGLSNPQNYYQISTGLKYRPRWPALMQRQVGVPALEKPRTNRNRQNYDSAVYVCPSVPEWTDERNAAYGYNYQFLGSHRTIQSGEPRNLPVTDTPISRPADTVVAGDCNGSAAAVPAVQRQEYQNSGRNVRQRGNYGWLLDPPRLEAGSSRAGGTGSPRSGPEDRHGSLANMLFADGHAASMSLKQLGYGVTADGRIVDNGLEAHNHLFSGTGADLAPP